MNPAHGSRQHAVADEPDARRSHPHDAEHAGTLAGVGVDDDEASRPAAPPLAERLGRLVRRASSSVSRRPSKSQRSDSSLLCSSRTTCQSPAVTGRSVTTPSVNGSVSGEGRGGVRVRRRGASLRLAQQVGVHDPAVPLTGRGRTRPHLVDDVGEATVHEQLVGRAEVGAPVELEVGEGVDELGAREVRRRA